MDASLGLALVVLLLMGGAVVAAFAGVVPEASPDSREEALGGPGKTIVAVLTVVAAFVLLGRRLR